jgi:hypothetical protein
MPFCTTCGANVVGTFCSQCGTPAAGAAASAPPPPAQPMPPQQAMPQQPFAQQQMPPQPIAQPPYAQQYPQPMPMAPVARKTSPIVWVLVAVLGLFVLGGIAVAGFAAYVAHRVHQAVQVNGKDGGFTLHTRGANGKDAVVQFGGSGKVPSWVPSYPGSEGRAKFAVTGSADGGEGGAFTFTTSDDPTRVKNYYSDKAKNMGLTINMDTTSPEGGMIVAAEDGGDHRSLQVIVGQTGGETSVNVIYGRK